MAAPVNNSLKIVIQDSENTRYEVAIDQDNLAKILVGFPEDQFQQLQQARDAAIAAGQDFLVIKIDAAKDAHNLHKILSRKKGEKFFVDITEKLQSTATMGRGFSYNAKVAELQVRAVFTSAIQNLQGKLANQNLSGIQKVALQSIFFGDLARVTRRIFDRSEISEAGALEKILAPQIRGKHAEFTQSLKDIAGAKNINEFYEKLQTVESKLLAFNDTMREFAQSLGVDYEKVTGSGSGGARFSYHHLDGKVIGTDPTGKPILVKGKIFVVKPDDEGPHGKDNDSILGPIKRFFTAKRGLINNSEALAEEDAYKLDRALHLRLVPPTFVQNLQSKCFSKVKAKPCSLQLFVRDCQTLGQKVDVPEWMHGLPNFIIRWWATRTQKKRDAVNSLPQLPMELAGLGSKLWEDTDSHLGNMLVKKRTDRNMVAARLLDETRFKVGSTWEKPTDEEIEGLVDQFFSTGKNQLFLQELFRASSDGVMLIKHDGGASHPHHHPTTYIEGRFKHLFTLLPQFDGHFSPAAKAFLQGKYATFETFLIDKAHRALKMVNVPAQWLERGTNKETLKNWILKERPTTKEAKQQFAKETRMIAGSIVYEMERTKYKAIKESEGEAPVARAIPLADDEIRPLADVQREQKHLAEKAGEDRIFGGDPLSGDKLDEFITSRCKSDKHFRKEVKNCEYQLNRVRQGIQTRLDCWKITVHHLENENDKSMHELFKIQFSEQYKAKLKEIKRLHPEAERPVPKRLVESGKGPLSHSDHGKGGHLGGSEQADDV